MKTKTITSRESVTNQRRNCFRTNFAYIYFYGFRLGGQRHIRNVVALAWWRPRPDDDSTTHRWFCNTQPISRQTTYDTHIVYTTAIVLVCCGWCLFVAAALCRYRSARRILIYVCSVQSVACNMHYAPKCGRINIGSMWIMQNRRATVAHGHVAIGSAMNRWI